MTLNTLVGFEEYTDPREFHDWINRELLKANDPVIEITGPEGQQIGPTHYWRRNTIANRRGQGLSALLVTQHNNGDVVADIFGEDDDPNLRVYANLDTGYGYRDAEGRGCTDLHRDFIARIIDEFANPRGLTVWWHNEFTGVWHKYIEGLADCAGCGPDTATRCAGCSRQGLTGTM